MRESFERRGFRSRQSRGDKRGWLSASQVRAQEQAAIDHNDVPNQGRIRSESEEVSSSR